MLLASVHIDFLPMEIQIWACGQFPHKESGELSISIILKGGYYYLNVKLMNVWLMNNAIR